MKWKSLHKWVKNASTALVVFFNTNSEAFPQHVVFESVHSSTYWNSHRPSGQNDGWIWQGKGLTKEGGISVRATVSWLEFKLNPSILFTQNLSFRESGRVSSRIDLPERLYQNSNTSFQFVNSSMFLNVFNLAMGISNETRWWGPGVRNAIILSSHAPGFDHFRVQTVRPQQIAVGTLHAEYILGRLLGSEIDPERYPEGWRLFTGLNLVYSPTFISGLSIGLNRSFVANQSDINSTIDYFPLFQPFQKNNLGSGIDGSGSAPDDQRVSLFFNWHFRSSGSRVYAEFGREDHNMDLRDAFMQPGHIRAYLIGVEKSDKKSVTNVEFTQMQVNVSTSSSRPQSPWYGHGKVKRGYTHLGQVLGAGVGPGGSSLFFQHEQKQGNDAWSLFLERAEQEVDFFYFSPSMKKPREVEYLIGVSRTEQVGRLLLRPEIEYLHVQNQGNVEGRIARNVALRLRLQYSF